MKIRNLLRKISNEIAATEAKEAEEAKKNKQGSQGSQKEKFLEVGGSDDYDKFVSKTFSYLLSKYFCFELFCLLVQIFS